MLICEHCGQRGFTPFCSCGNLRVPPDALDDPELYGIQDDDPEDDLDYEEFDRS